VSHRACAAARSVRRSPTRLTCGRFGSAFLKQNLMASVDSTSISAPTASAFGATQGNRAVTKNLALAASMVMLMTISGQAFAETPALSRSATNVCKSHGF